MTPEHCAMSWGNQLLTQARAELAKNKMLQVQGRSIAQLDWLRLAGMSICKELACEHGSML